MEKTVDISTPDGFCDSYIAIPNGNGRYPALILYMDIWGLREELFEIAREISSLGYICIVPNFYYRQGKIRFDYRNNLNQVVSVNSLPEFYKEKMRTALNQLSNTMIIKDTEVILDFLGKQSYFSSFPVATLGFCMGGRHVLCAGYSFPEKIQAMISLHGTKMISNETDSPHLNFNKLKGQLYCGYAELDPHTDQILIQEMKKKLASNSQLSYEYRIHENANHGYALKDRDIYDGSAWNYDWQKITELLINLKKINSN